MIEGTVVKLYSGAADIAWEDEALVHVETCPLRGKARFVGEGEPVASPLAVGDRVLLSRQAGGLVVEGRRRRRTKLSRRHPSSPRREQVIAANVDQVLVVAAAERPSFNPRLVDRYLVAASAEGLATAVCVTKCDLVPTERVDALAERFHHAGTPVLRTGLHDPVAVERLRAILVGRATVLVGASGAGKSTLRNALLPERAGVARTREVSAKWGKGRHATTAATFEPLPPRGFLVDTPGVREFGLFQLHAHELHRHFPEFAEAECRFADCTHGSEPGCALRRLVEEGRAREDRLDSLLAIAASLKEATPPAGR